jgi:hypothetical protein
MSLIFSGSREEMLVIAIGVMSLAQEKGLLW